MPGAGKLSTRYVLPESLNFQQLQKEVSRNYAVRRVTAPAAAFTLYDSFDWRLFKNRLILIREGSRIGLHDLGSTQASSQAEWGKRKAPRFWWDLPEGGLRGRLEALLDVRALLPLISVTGRRYGQRILNRDEKTVLTLFFCTYDAQAGSASPCRAFRLELQPMLGYRPELEGFKRFLKDMDIIPDRGSVFVELMKRSGLNPGGYTSKFHLPLDPQIPSGQAMRSILGHLLGVMTMNEAGIKADTDTEFLHDYRVAVRRIRSALAQIKGIFPPEVTARFRKDFTRLGQSTSTLRDLDVYLLKKEQYRALLPGRLAPGLDTLFEMLAAERNKERRALSRSLNSAAYKTTMAKWRDFLDSPPGYPDDEAPNAPRPVFQLACRFIFKRYRRIIRAGRKIGDDSPDEELHRLRISCKKLRYLLEFFASLFPEDDMARLIGQLKKLQDNLGDFNDLFVQQQYLEAHLNKLVVDQGRLRQSAAAVGGLITSLNRKQRSVRRDFDKRFQSFSSAKNQALFTRLFRTPSPGGEQR